MFPPIRTTITGVWDTKVVPQNVTEAPRAERRVGVPEGRLTMATRVFAVDLGAWSVKLAIASPGIRGATLLNVVERLVPPRRRAASSSARRRALASLDRRAAAARRDRLHRRLRRPGVHPGPRVRVQEPAPRELDKAVGGELEGVVPVDLEDMVYTFEPIPDRRRAGRAGAGEVRAAASRRRPRACAC